MHQLILQCAELDFLHFVSIGSPKLAYESPDLIYFEKLVPFLLWLDTLLLGLLLVLRAHSVGWQIQHLVIDFHVLLPSDRELLEVDVLKVRLVRHDRQFRCAEPPSVESLGCPVAHRALEMRFFV